MNPRGKVIYAESDGFFRITLFTEFPPSIAVPPPESAWPQNKQEYAWKTGGKTVDDRGMWVSAFSGCLASPGKFMPGQRRIT